MIHKQTAQAQLWLGSHDNLHARVIAFLQEYFCAQNGCRICVVCKQIHEQQHYGVIWIAPEKTYTLETLAIIQERVAFALPDDQSCFFIVQKADFLTTQCANSLLKIIEEPPKGYHFILCAERKEYLLPTIISRCIISSFAQEACHTQHKTLYAYFTAEKPQNPISFLQEIQNSVITEHESLELADQLLAYWMNHYQQHMHLGNSSLSKKRVELFKQAILTPPMPGSSKLFWKNIFLHYHAVG